jgi:hypothetical protein
VRLNVLDAKSANLIQGFGHVLAKLFSQTVKLQTNPVFEVLIHVRLWQRVGARGRHTNQRTQGQQREEE